MLRRDIIQCVTENPIKCPGGLSSGSKDIGSDRVNLLVEKTGAKSGECPIVEVRYAMPCDNMHWRSGRAHSVYVCG